MQEAGHVFHHGALGFCELVNQVRTVWEADKSGGELRT